MRQQTTIAIRSAIFHLADSERPDDVQQRIEDAAKSGGRFVEFAALGARSVRVFVGTDPEIVLTVQIIDDEMHEPPVHRTFDVDLDL